MTTFAEELARLRSEHGYSQRKLASLAYCSAQAVSFFERGLRDPHPETAEHLDRALNAGGRLIELAARRPDGLVVVTSDPRAPLSLDDVASIYGGIGQLIALDTAQGSTGLTARATQAFREAEERLATVGADPHTRIDAAAAVAELGEVAAWIAYDADDQPTSRQLAHEALSIARAAGDTDMERFLLSHLAMQAAYVGRGAEALAIADRALADEPASARVRAMFYVRRARGLAELGDTDAALADLDRARHLLADGLRPTDPAWTWWLHEAELCVHEARVRAGGGDLTGAVDLSARSVAALPPRQGRDGVLYRAWLLHDLVAAGSWAEADGLARDILARGAGKTARVRVIAAAALAAARRQRAPRRVLDALDALAA